MNLICDRELPEDDEILAAFPTRTGRHDLYEEALRFVSAKHSKGALVALVNWLLSRLAASSDALAEIQWSGHEDYSCCPSCKMSKDDGHANKCRVARALGAKGRR